jgi:hypothetical protein
VRQRGVACKAAAKKNPGSANPHIDQGTLYWTKNYDGPPYQTKFHFDCFAPKPGKPKWEKVLFKPLISMVMCI